MEIGRVFKIYWLRLPSIRSVLKIEIVRVFKNYWLRLPSMTSVLEMELGRVFKNIGSAFRPSDPFDKWSSVVFLKDIASAFRS